MPLSDAEAFVYDYITKNVEVREFWEGKMAYLRGSCVNDFQANEQLKAMLMRAYATPEAIEELTGLIDQIALMTIDWRRLSSMLLEHHIGSELRATHKNSPQSLGVRFFENWPVIFQKRYEGDAPYREAKEREYESAVRLFKRLEQSVFWGSLFVGICIAGWLLWVPASEFSWAKVGGTVLLGLVIAFFVMLLPACFIELFRPKRNS